MVDVKLDYNMELNVYFFGWFLYFCYGVILLKERKYCKWYNNSLVILIFNVFIIFIEVEFLIMILICWW